MADPKVIQVGVKALRKPNGDFEKATPIYMAATPELVKREAAVVASLEAVDAHYLKAYIEARDKVPKQARAADLC